MNIQTFLDAGYELVPREPNAPEWDFERVYKPFLDEKGNTMYSIMVDFKLSDCGENPVAHTWLNLGLSNANIYVDSPETIPMVESLFANAWHDMGALNLLDKNH